MTKQEVTTRYEKLLRDVAEKDFYTKIDLTNRLNVYTCESCGHSTVTKDVDAGVTPFWHQCEACGQGATSSFYRVAEGLKATQEWYRPTLEDCLKIRKHSPGLLEHVLKGGLSVRKIKV